MFLPSGLLLYQEREMLGASARFGSHFVTLVMQDVRWMSSQENSSLVKFYTLVSVFICFCFKNSKLSPSSLKKGHWDSSVCEDLDPKFDPQNSPSWQERTNYWKLSLWSPYMSLGMHRPTDVHTYTVNKCSKMLRFWLCPFQFLTQSMEIHNSWMCIFSSMFVCVFRQHFLCVAVTL